MRKKLIAVVMMMTLAMLPVLAGCGAKGAGGGGSVVNVQVGPSPETIDPALNSAVDGANMIIHAFEGLLKFDRDNNIVSGLAESYDVSDDGLTWTFHLRDGLKWSDGSALTANDFVYSAVSSDLPQNFGTMGTGRVNRFVYRGGYPDVPGTVFPVPLQCGSRDGLLSGVIVFPSGLSDCEV